MMIALLAAHASTNVRLRQYQKAISTRSILISALTAVLALMFVPLRLFIPYSKGNQKK